MSQPGSENRLIELQRSWRENPDSTVYLELAEELRRHQRSQEAIQVLEQGLSKHPDDINALVALGRCRLEARHLSEAAQALQVVLGRESGHLVANKLLVETYLENGQAENARERLETYRRLNPNDPEIQRLDARLAQLSQPVPPPVPDLFAAPPAPVVPAPPAAGGVFDLGAPAPVASDSTDLFALAPPPAPPGSDSTDLFALAPPPAAPAPPPAAPAPPAPAPPEPVMPEPVMPEPVAPAPAAPAPPPAPEPVVPAPVAPELPRAEPDVPHLEAGMPAAPSPSSVYEDVAPAAPDFGSAPSEPNLEEPSFEPDQPAFASIEAAPEPPETAIEPPQSFAASPAPVIDVPAASEPQKVPVSQEMPESQEESEPEPAATATLGELYLRQGHYEEAGNIFRQVLAKDPDNTAASEGLKKIEARETARTTPSNEPPTEETKAVTAEELLAHYASPASLRGLTAKKIVVLDSYLKHLRRNG